MKGYNKLIPSYYKNQKPKRNNLEHEIQSKYFEILKLNNNKFPFLNYIFAIPNGGNRDAKTGAQLKREGVKRGVPDIFLPFKMFGYPGLWLETKVPGRTQSKEQKSFEKHLCMEGYLYKVCFSTMDLIKETENYLNIKLTNL